MILFNCLKTFLIKKTLCAVYVLFIHVVILTMHWSLLILLLLTWFSNLIQLCRAIPFLIVKLRYLFKQCPRFGVQPAITKYLVFMCVKTKVMFKESLPIWSIDKVASLSLITY